MVLLALVCLSIAFDILFVNRPKHLESWIVFLAALCTMFILFVCSLSVFTGEYLLEYRIRK